MCISSASLWQKKVGSWAALIMSMFDIYFHIRVDSQGKARWKVKDAACTYMRIFGLSNLHEFKTESGEIPLGIKSENTHHKQRVD